MYIEILNSFAIKGFLFLLFIQEKLDVLDRLPLLDRDCRRLLYRNDGLDLDAAGAQFNRIFEF